MAGDINTGEVLILGELPGGFPPLPIVHEYGPSVRVGLTGTDTDLPTIQYGFVNLDNLSFTEQMGHAAFLLRQSPSYLEEKRNRPHRGEGWYINPPKDADAPPVARAPRPTNRLAGPFAVGEIVVSGATPSLQFSSAERTKLYADVQNGLSFLAKHSPAKDITWKHEAEYIDVTAPNTISGKDYEDFEAPWRDAALTKLGLPLGRLGVLRHVQALRLRHKTNWAYCAFFTKYNLHHFAYAYVGGPYLVMDYANDGWGPSNIDSVFAHETGHIFGAPDEYGSCDCHEVSGPFGVTNGNCAACVGVSQVKCIMNNNDWSMCRYTPYHLGYNKLPKFVP